MMESSIRRRTLLAMSVAIAAGGLVVPGYAQSGRGPTVAIERLNAALLTAMRLGQAAPFAQRFRVLAPAIDEAFDLGAILRLSVGPSWASLPVDQQRQLQVAFRRYTIASYVANFDSYDGEAIQTASEVTPIAGGDQVVATRILRSSGSAAVLSYVMRATANGWKAIDVLADGRISRVAVQRSDFRNVLTQGGSAALVARLQRKVADLSGGAFA